LLSDNKTNISLVKLIKKRMMMMIMIGKMKMKITVKMKKKMNRKYYILSMEGAVSPWLLCIIPDWVVHIGALAGRGHCVPLLG